MKITLTPNQTQAVIEATSFIDSQASIFILTGAAGTGKTTVVGNIIDSIYEKIDELFLLAPTNRAAKILSRKTQHDTNTIHSEIYDIQYIKNSDELIIASKFIPKIQRFHFSDKDLNLSKTNKRLFIIDEASMISTSVQREGDFISDNSLLQDLYSHAFKHSSTDKMIFVGDTYQLPPIGHIGLPPALDPGFLKSKFNCSLSSFQLTKIHRQQQNSEILSIANTIKNKIDRKFSNYILSIDDKFENYKIFIEQAAKAFDLNNLVYSIALGWTRKNVLSMNLDIRKILYGSTPRFFEVGDVLYLNARWDQKDLSIAKGEIGIVKEVLSLKEEKSGLLFSTLKLEFRTIKDEPFEVLSKVLISFPYSIEEFIPKDYFIKLAIVRSRENDLYKKTREATDDVYMNTMQLKFAYALTVHKSQGGEWENVFLHANTNKKDLRWNYTAVTRASKNIYSFKNRYS